MAVSMNLGFLFVGVVKKGRMDLYFLVLFGAADFSIFRNSHMSSSQLFLVSQKYMDRFRRG